MTALLITISITLTMLLLLRATKKSRSMGESKLSILAHPSTFEKPDIEVVSRPAGEKVNDQEVKVGCLADLTDDATKE